MINRRAFIGGTAATFCMPANIAFGLSKNTPTDNVLFAASRKNPDGSFSAAIIDPQGSDVVSVPLPARGHDAIQRPGTDTIVIFARRPGNFALAISASQKHPPQWFSTKEERHFYGHGIFSPDGKLLYATENDYENERGVIGIRDATDNYRQIGEFSSDGVGPHDITLLADSKTAVVANGGILTHPEMGRQKLNLSTMQPSLTYLDLRSGDVVEQVSLPKSLHQLSIRHLAIAKNDLIVFGCQYQGAKRDLPPLIGFHKRGEEPKLVTAPLETHRSMKNYVGSVTIDASSHYVAASCPRGNLVTYWDVATQTYVGMSSMQDVCGLAKTQKAGEFLQTSGEGQIVIAHPGSEEKSSIQNRNAMGAWDNHAICIAT